MKPQKYIYIKSSGQVKYRQAGLTVSKLHPCCQLYYEVSFTYSISTGRQMDELSWKGSKLRWTFSLLLPLCKVILQHNRSDLFPHALFFLFFLSSSSSLALTGRKLCMSARPKPLHTRSSILHSWLLRIKQPVGDKIVALPQKQQYMQQAACYCIRFTGSQHPNGNCNLWEIS